MTDTAPEATREAALVKIKAHLSDQGALTWTIGTREEFLVRSHDLLVEFMNCAPSVHVPSEAEMREILTKVMHKKGWFVSCKGDDPRKIEVGLAMKAALAAMRELASRMGGKS